MISSGAYRFGVCRCAGGLGWRIAPLRCQGCEVLLPALQRGHLFARYTLEIHPEPQHGNKDARHTGGDILSRLEAFFARQFLYSAVVGLYLGHDRGTVGKLLLRLHNSNRLRRTASACA